MRGITFFLFVFISLRKKVYEEPSGHQLNRAKTSLFFSDNTERVVKEEIKTRFGA